jgi:outer membrane protein assembly factor BamB
VKRSLLLGLCAFVLAGCGDHARQSSHPTSPKRGDATARSSTTHLVSALRVPLVRSRILPGYLLVADRNNNRVLLLSPHGRIMWRRVGLREPDDAFFTPGYRGIITNEEFDDTLRQISLRTRRIVWSYGHAGVPGRGSGYLNAPDDAYRLANGTTTVADIRNCRIVQVRRDGSVLRVLGGSCAHDPPRGFASPNGDTPLSDGGILVTEIGGWVDRLDRSGRVLWSVRTPFSYPSDAQLLPNGHILVCAFTTPGRVVEMTRAGRIVWSFGAASGKNCLDRPSLAIRLPNGLVAVNDDWRHRVILVNPRTSRIVWQYGHTDIPSAAPGYLDKPDGMDFLPASTALHAAFVASTATRRPSGLQEPAPAVSITRIGSLPSPTSRLAAVALADGRVLALGGLVTGTSSSQILAGPPRHLVRIGSLPSPTHDAAAVVSRHGAVELYGGGQSVSSAEVVRIDPSTGSVRRLASLDEPLSDLGAAVVRGRTYLVGGFTGARYASAILRVERNNRTHVVARLPAGTRYAGVAVRGDAIYVAGGVTESGPSDAVYRVEVQSGRVSRIATLPRPTAHAPLVAALGGLWLVGGDGSRSVLRIDPTSGRVSYAARLPEVLANAAAVKLADGRIAVLGGDGSGAVWAFNPTPLTARH